MSISSTNRKAGPYAGNDVTTEFPFGFNVFSADDVVVVRSDLQGVDSTLVLGTDYVVSLNADQDASPGGTVTVTSAPAAGVSLTLTSDVQELQPVDLNNMGGFYPRVINTALDRLTILVQQLSEKVSRALKYSISSPLGNSALPAPVANNVIGWNSEANGFTNYPPVDNVLLSAALVSGSGSSLIGFVQGGRGAVAETVQSKLREIVSVKDFGAVGDGVADDLAAVQSAINTKEVNFNASNYAISAPLKLPSLASLMGKNAGAAFTGAVANVKHAIHKTTNTPVSIVNFQTSVTSNIDCLAYTDPNWIDSGVSYPQKTSIEKLAFKGHSTPNHSGIYIEQGGGYCFRELDFSGVTHAVYAKEAWMCMLERVHALAGMITWMGGTSITLTNCWAGGGAGGFSFVSTIYSTMTSCSSDGATNTAYRFANSKFTLNSCGCEGAETVTANSGTAIAFDGSNDIVVNNFNAIPKANQTIAIYSAKDNDKVTFNNGCSSFGVAGVNCPDIYVSGNGSTVVFNDYTFINGTTDSPVVQFASGITTSKVIVNFGANQKVYTSTGSGNVITEALMDSGVFTPSLSFAYGTTGMTYASRSGKWQKSGKTITVSGRIALSSKGSSTGVPLISGWPTFNQQGDAALSIALMTGIVGGPLVGTIDASGASQAVFNVRTATGDAAATEANFTNSTVIWFSFSYQTA